MPKWTKREMSKDRARRRLSFLQPYLWGVTWSKEEFHNHIQPIFDSAPKFSELAKQDKTVVLFLGRSMRSIFEATKVIGDLSETGKRKSIKYFVPPQEKHLRILEGKGVAALAGELNRQKIVTAKKRVYYIVDYKRGGSTLRLMERAIKMANPEAEVRIITQENQEFGAAINTSNYMPRPTTKTEGIPVKQQASDPRITASYLLFQEELKRFAKTLKK